MIHTVRGKIAARQGQRIIVEMGGIGLGIAVPFPEQQKIGEEIFLYTVLHWNEETGPSIYGFDTHAEKEFFIAVTNCSGMGPKLAFSLLQQSTVVQLAAALVRGDCAYLSSLKGIGAKKAESLVMQLRSKVEHLLISVTAPTEGADTAHVSALQVIRDVAGALQALRYSSVEITQALEQVRQQAVPDASFDVLMRIALTYLSRAAAR